MWRDIYRWVERKVHFVAKNKYVQCELERNRTKRISCSVCGSEDIDNIAKGTSISWVSEQSPKNFRVFTMDNDL